MKNIAMQNTHGKQAGFASARIRLILLNILLLCILCCAAGPAHADRNTDYLPELPWSESGAAYLNDESERYLRPQCGPGYEYQVFKSMNGKKRMYNTREMTRVDICFTNGDWVYAGFGYSDGKWRFGFFHRSVFTPYDGWWSIPEYSLGYECRGTVTGKVIPKNGPGWDYPEYESCRLSRGDMAYACMQSNGWYLCRFYNNHSNRYGYVYLWVPGSMISFF